VSDIPLLHVALLHDSYEETEDTWYLQLIIRIFVHFGPGRETSTDVLHLSKQENESSDAYFARIIASGRWRVLIAKLVDRIDNLWTLSKKEPERSRAKILETVKWFPKITEELKRLLDIEIESGTLSHEWLLLARFIDGYLWYAVRIKQKEFDLT
jgi:(p)ppGpp synthase/HD superfamily hydrolase